MDRNISIPKVLKNISRVSAPNEWNIFNTSLQLLKNKKMFFFLTGGGGCTQFKSREMGLGLILKNESAARRQ